MCYLGFVKLLMDVTIFTILWNEIWMIDECVWVVMHLRIIYVNEILDDLMNALRALIDECTDYICAVM